KFGGQERGAPDFGNLRRVIGHDVDADVETAGGVGDVADGGRAELRVEAEVDLQLRTRRRRQEREGRSSLQGDRRYAWDVHVHTAFDVDLEAVGDRLEGHLPAHHHQRIIEDGRLPHVG